MGSEQRADGWRDALAILAGALREDYEGIGTVLESSASRPVISALASMLFESLRDRDIDPAGWVRDQQARARDDLAE